MLIHAQANHHRVFCTEIADGDEIQNLLPPPPPSQKKKLNLVWKTISSVYNSHMKINMN